MKDMAPKNKFTKDEMIAAALRVVRAKLSKRSMLLRCVYMTATPRLA